MTSDDSKCSADYGITAENTTIPKERIAKLRDVHVRLYEHRLSLCPTDGIREDEVRLLLSIWESMEGKEFHELDEYQRGEVLDAIDSGEG